MKIINKKDNLGITLIALVITIVIMLILTGLTLQQLTGEKGLILSTRTSKEINNYNAAKEEINIVLMEVAVECQNNHVPYSIDAIVEAIRNDNEKEILKMFNNNTASIKLGAEIINPTDIVITVKKYSKYKFLVGEKQGSDEVEGIKGVTTREIDDDTAIQEFDIIEDFDKVILGAEEKIKDVNIRNSGLIGAISRIKQSRYSSLELKGKTSVDAEEETVNLGVHTIVYQGDMVLDGTNNYTDIGISFNNNVYEVGDNTVDVATANSDAQYMVVLKVIGNLTIDSNITLTACKSNTGYGGPKGLFIYCAGTLTNNGKISMTARGAKAKGENIYLWKNAEDNNTPFEFIPKDGANGGETSTCYSVNHYYAVSGSSGKYRKTGGGASRFSI